MKNRSLLGYGTVAALVFVADRLTKWLAQIHCVEPCELNQFVSFTLVQNPGITWGLFGAPSGLMSVLLTATVMTVTGFLCLLGYRRWLKGQMVVPEALIVGGSCSNILDRLVYGGVLDFIVLSYKEWSWPVFNVADMFIVVGVIWLAIEMYHHEGSLA